MPVTTRQTANYVKFIRGTTAAYEALTPKDSDTLYFISDNNSTGRLYLGTKLISGSGGAVSLADLTDVIISQAGNNDVLVFNGTNWVPTSVTTLIGNMVGASASQAGAAGLVPAPAIGDQNKFLRGDGSWATIQGGVNFDNNIFTDNNGVETLVGYDNATTGQLLQKGSNNSITWVSPSDLTAALQQSVNTLQQTVDRIATGAVDRVIVNGTVDDIDVTAEDAENHIYMVPNSDYNTPGSHNRYSEYMVINGVPELIGSNLSGEITGYVTTTQFNNTVDTMYNDFVLKTVYAAEVGNLANLLHPQTQNTVTIVDQVNELTNRLTWYEVVES